MYLCPNVISHTEINYTNIMKKILIIAAVALLSVACNSSKEKDPVSLAIEQKLMKDVAGDYQFNISQIAKVDSTLLSTELDRRQEVFELKIKAEKERYEMYLSKNMKQNAQKHLESMKKAERNLQFIKETRERLAERLDEIAYYDYLFSGSSKVDGQTTKYENVYFTITPSGEILSVTAKLRDLHKSTGKVIPGYLEYITSDDEIQ